MINIKSSKPFASFVTNRIVLLFVRALCTAARKIAKCWRLMRVDQGELSFVGIRTSSPPTKNACFWRDTTARLKRFDER